ncbi:hypothetical protein LR48_Vigan11g052800 [Vigna angularis]|uniref:Uncharacterized protein n=1 Tax=Phaseolus angularis TaxID=3914 RepID=A0A0L9VR15_PHAAN|nr:hypothetical protein LR48_Vigan11g052800 [Vigna angularis]
MKAADKFALSANLRSPSSSLQMGDAHGHSWALIPSLLSSPLHLYLPANIYLVFSIGPHGQTPIIFIHSFFLASAHCNYKNSSAPHPIRGRRGKEQERRPDAKTDDDPGGERHHWRDLRSRFTEVGPTEKQRQRGTERRERKGEARARFRRWRQLAADCAEEVATRVQGQPFPGLPFSKKNERERKGDSTVSGSASTISDVAGDFLGQLRGCAAGWSRRRGRWLPQMMKKGPQDSSTAGWEGDPSGF